MATSLVLCVDANSRRSPIRSCIGLGGLVLFSTIAGCRKSQNTHLAESVSVSGSITLDGEPLKAGAIVLHSVADENSPVAPAAYGYIEDGYYRIDAERGLAAGKVRANFGRNRLNASNLNGSLKTRGGNAVRPSWMSLGFPRTTALNPT
jgi:hypothetical protein